MAGLLFLGLARGRGAPLPLPERRGRDLLRIPLVAKMLRWRTFQTALTTPAMLLLWVVVLTTLFGTQMAGRNLGSLLLWMAWLFVLVLVLTPLAGRAWCTMCPLPVLGDVLQRGTLTGVRLKDDLRAAGRAPENNRTFGLGRPFPRLLSNGWPRLFLFLLLGTFSVTLVALPRVTGLLLLSMVALAAVLAVLFERRAFCRFLCPITAFVSLYGKTGRLALRPRDREVCRRCNARTCMKGSALGWGCPFGVDIPELDRNDECGLCTECVKTCPFDNVGLYFRPFATENSVKELPVAILAVVMLVLGVAYSLVFLGPWPGLRDRVDLIDRPDAGLFAGYAIVLWGVALVVAPLLLFAATRLGRRLGRIAVPSRELFVESTAPLVVLGLGIWGAFVIPMLLVNRTFLLQSLSDPFGWGWDLIGAAGSPFRQIWPAGLPWLQVFVLLFAFRYALRNGWRIFRERTADPRAALLGFAPTAALLTGLTGWLVFFYAG